MRVSLILACHQPDVDLQAVVAGLALTLDERAEVEVVVVGLHEPLPHPSPGKGGASAPLNSTSSLLSGGGTIWSSPPSLAGKGVGGLGRAADLSPVPSPTKGGVFSCLSSPPSLLGKGVGGLG